jgi:hypothetical protein
MNTNIRIQLNTVEGTRQQKPIFKIVDTEDPPLRFALGAGVLPMARTAYADRLATWEAWEAVSNAAQGEPRKHTVAPF